MHSATVLLILLCKWEKDFWCCTILSSDMKVIQVFNGDKEKLR